MPVRGADDRPLSPRHPGGAFLRPPADRGTGRRLIGLGAPPAGYRSLRVGGATWWVAGGEVAGFETSAAARLLDGPARRAATPEEGRGGVRRFRVGDRAVVGKRLLHGGLLGGVTGGAFLGAARVREAVAASARLRADGVPTPEVIAGGWRPIAGPFGALALVTAEIVSGRNLLQLLAPRGAGRRERRALLRAAGETVARLEAAGFAHADLNLANLVATLEGDVARVAVVDLEGGRFASAPTATPGAGAHLRRLMRSWEKRIEPRAPGSLRDLAAFLRGYSAAPDVRRRAARDLLQYRSALGARRIGWRLGGAGAVSG